MARGGCCFPRPWWGKGNLHTEQAQRQSPSRLRGKASYASSEKGPKFRFFLYSSILIASSLQAWGDTILPQVVGSPPAVAQDGLTSRHGPEKSLLEPVAGKDFSSLPSAHRPPDIETDSVTYGPYRAIHEQRIDDSAVVTAGGDGGVGGLGGATAFLLGIVVDVVGAAVWWRYGTNVFGVKTVVKPLW